MILGIATALCVFAVAVTFVASRRSRPAEDGAVLEKMEPKKERPIRIVPTTSVRQIDDSVKDKNVSKEDSPNKADAPVDSSKGDEANVVIKAEGDEKASLSNPDLNPAAMDELGDIFSQVAFDDITDGQLAQRLSCYKPSAILAAAGSVMKFGTSDEKKNALCAVGMFFGKEGSTGVSFELTHPKREIAIGENGEELASPAAERPTGDLVSTVYAGVSDQDAGVRDTAFDVMHSLPDEERGVLAANILSGGDVGLQQRLMAEAGEGEDGVRILLMGMGSESQEVRSIAAEGLRNAFGQEFASQKEAAEWYEAHHREFLQGAEASAAPVAVESVQTETVK